jgi:hypothetical protein
LPFVHSSILILICTKHKAEHTTFLLSAALDYCYYQQMSNESSTKSVKPEPVVNWS